MRTDINTITAEVISAAIRVHRHLGPGLLESVYESVLSRELDRMGLIVKRQHGVSFEFEGMQFGDVLKADLHIEELVVVELKSVETLLPVHSKQVLTYLRLLNLQVGLLLNFGCETLRQGIRRIANNYSEASSEISRSDAEPQR